MRLSRIFAGLVLLLALLPASARPASADDVADCGNVMGIGGANPESVVAACRRLAEQGDAGAQYTLGVMYYSGLHVPQDHAQALKWYRKAADQGVTVAQNKLGGMYYLGLHVPQDYVQAHMWFDLAAAQGDANAAQNRDIVASKMTPAQIAEAEQLAREWLAAYPQ